jgi:hypothetical protein
MLVKACLEFIWQAADLNTKVNKILNRGNIKQTLMTWNHWN